KTNVNKNFQKNKIFNITKSINFRIFMNIPSISSMFMFLQKSCRLVITKDSPFWRGLNGRQKSKGVGRLKKYRCFAGVSLHAAANFASLQGERIALRFEALFNLVRAAGCALLSARPTWDEREDAGAAFF
ncbi:MAG: hypothetical protein JXR73_02910, partial [Candidatus Omnitrophica bacterium]|nr:hypothetical protein [Candidatus Omnitrophota bacterium]